MQRSTANLCCLIDNHSLHCAVCSDKTWRRGRFASNEMQANASTIPSMAKAFYGDEWPGGDYEDYWSTPDWWQPDDAASA